ncbi:MAG: PhoH family protein [Patescibacteria group bacterium]|jgi:PhoH-like ATPase
MAKNQSEEKGSGENNFPEKVYVVDTSALEHSIDVFENLRERGKNLIVMPFVVWEELDGHKSGSDFKGRIARTVIRQFSELLDKKDKSVTFLGYEMPPAKSGKLRRDKNDHLIIATAYFAQKNKYRGKTVVLVTQDNNMRALALHFGLITELVKDSVSKQLINKNGETKKKKTPKVLDKEIRENHTFPYKKKYGEIPQNGAIICKTNCGGAKKGWDNQFIAIRQGDEFRIINRNINIFGITPKANNGDINWGQFHAMTVLKDQRIPLITLTGKAGTAKTFLAILAGISQTKEYKKILISRATIQLGYRDRLGFSPGDIEDKMKPWLLPIYDNIEVIKNLLPSMKDKIDEMIKKRVVEILDLDKIRGRSIQNCFIIIDETQNLPPDQVLAIATRAAEGSKIIFTGDFTSSQIDVPYLDEKSNGLSILTEVMRGSQMFATVHLDQAIRSPLVQEILNRWAARNEALRTKE